MTALGLLLAAALAGPPEGSGTDTRKAEVSQVSAGRAQGVEAPQVPSPVVAGASASTGAAQIAGPSNGPTAVSDVARPSEGRTAAPAIVLPGEDICADPARRRGAEAFCANVLEHRAAEFERPARPALTAEQRLLVQQQTGAITADDAARRLGGPRGTSSPEAQAVAAAVSSAATSAQDETDTKAPLPDISVDAILDTVLTAPNPR